MNVEIIGPRGAGKSKLGSAIGTDLDLAYVSLGELARREIRSATPLGLQMQVYLDNNQLYPRGFLNGLIQQNILTALETKNGFVLDGYPRHRSEAEDLSEVLKNLGAQIDLLIDLRAPLDVIKDRVSNRLICINCDLQETVAEADKPQACPNCRTELQQRKDDNPEEIERAYGLYEAEAVPMLEVLEPLTLFGVLSLDGSNEFGYLLGVSLFNLTNSTSKLPK